MDRVLRYTRSRKVNSDIRQLPDSVRVAAIRPRCPSTPRSRPRPPRASARTRSMPIPGRCIVTSRSTDPACIDSRWLRTATGHHAAQQHRRGARNSERPGVDRCPQRPGHPTPTARSRCAPRSEVGRHVDRDDRADRAVVAHRFEQQVARARHRPRAGHRRREPLAARPGWQGSLGPPAPCCRAGALPARDFVKFVDTQVEGQPQILDVATIEGLFDVAADASPSSSDTTGIVSSSSRCD